MKQMSVLGGHCQGQRCAHAALPLAGVPVSSDAPAPVSLVVDHHQPACPQQVWAGAEQPAHVQVEGGHQAPPHVAAHLHTKWGAPVDAGAEHAGAAPCYKQLQVCTSEVAADTWLTRSLRRQPRKPSFAQPSMPDFTASRCMGASGRRQPASRLAPAAALPEGTSTPPGLPPACRCRLEGRPPSSAACICPCCGEGRGGGCAARRRQGLPKTLTAWGWRANAPLSSVPGAHTSVRVLFEHAQKQEHTDGAGKVGPPELRQCSMRS